MTTASTPRSVDVAIIGAGTAGLGARRAAQKAGASVVMIDPGPFGTTCARVGCMPSKLLIAAAEAAYHARHTDVFGVTTEGVHVDGRAVMRRVQKERDRFVGFVEDVIEEAREADELIVGRARIAEPGRLVVDDAQEVHYRGLVIAAGSAPFIPPPFRDLEQFGLTNEDVFELEDLPESLLVIGLGVIGLELGQAFARLGVRTTLLGVGDAVGPLSDPELRSHARTILADELDLHPHYELKNVKASESGVDIEYVDSRGTSRRETYARILIAAGRRSGLLGLGVDNLGVKANDQGRFAIDPDTLQLDEQPVFVAGDANDLHPLLHEASDDGRLAGANAASFPSIRALQRRTPLTIAFSDPQIAVVGGGYDAVAPCEAVAGEVDFGNQGRARVHAIHRGKLRIYAEKRTGRLLGAEIFGPRAEHLAHLLAWAVQQGLSVSQALEMPFYHPVVEEGVRTALRNLNANLLHGAPIKCHVSELGPGA